MANQEMRDNKLTDVLRRLDADLNEPTKYAPPRVREAMVQTVQPTQRSTEMLSAGDTTVETIMRGVEELEKKTTALRADAEHMAQKLKAWTTNFENQRAQALEECNRLTNVVNESVERVIQIGKKLVEGNGGTETPQLPEDEPYPGRTRSGDMM